MGGRASRKHPFVSAFGARVRCVRFERCLTLTELAKRARVRTTHLESIEAGRIDPTLPTVLALGEALKVEPFDLLNVEHWTDERAGLLEETRHWSTRTVRSLNVVLGDRAGKVAIAQLEAEARSEGQRQEPRREVGPGLQKARAAAENRETSAPPAA